MSDRAKVHGYAKLEDAHGDSLDALILSDGQTIRLGISEGEVDTDDYRELTVEVDGRAFSAWAISLLTSEKWNIPARGADTPATKGE